MHKELSSLTHPIVQHLVKLKKSREYRYEQKRVLLEGKNAIYDVLKRHKAKRILVEPRVVLPEGLQYEELIVVPEKVLEKITQVVCSEGVIAELTMPEWGNKKQADSIVALDTIQDPGNLGTIIRTALAFGWEAIFLIGSCCDPFNDKALRAAKGATFDIPIQRCEWEDLRVFVEKQKYEAILADLDGKRPEEIKKRGKRILILGNEAAGPKPPRDFPCEKVTIPMNKKMESLNVAVAGGILMYELRPAGDL